MKTNAIAYPSVSSSGTPGTSRLAGFGRVLLATSCVSLVSFAAVPQAFAGANGTYEFTRASGSVHFGDHTIDLPESVVKRLAGVVNGKITIENNTLKLKKNATISIVETLGDELDFSVDASVHGPNSLVLTKTGNTYSGETANPIVVSFDGDFHGANFSGELVANVSATVEDRKLKVVITFSGDARGEDFSGTLKVIAKR
ncbi:MAG: hypothetical protein ABIS50_07600 [Luteolibacter sp.]|uniref:hypothetical protein n=1 Tax=Luteolibacter sp. TaxID=1962973 RepID=UPI0032657E88